MNVAPVILGLSGDALLYTEGDGPLVIEQGGNALVTDVDSADFAGGALIVSIAAGGDAAEDVLSIRDSGTPGFGIEVLGDTVLFDGTSIGTFTGGGGGTDLVVSLNGSATEATATALARAITYENINISAPTVGPRTVQFVLNDGDGGVSTAIDATVTVSELITNTLDVRVSSSADDAEERLSSGAIGLDSTDLEMTLERAEQIVGIRFNGIEIPKGAIITNAYVQFQADERDSGIASLTIHGEDADNASQFSTATGDISSRATTAASALWQPGDWNSVGEAGPNQQTADLSAVLQEIIDRDGWVSGNSLALLISGSGKRVAESFDGAQGAAPLLHVEYQFLDAGIPTVDLDADDSSGTNGNDFSSTFFIGDPPEAIADTDVAIADSNGTTLASATITLTSPEAGDTLLSGSLPAGIFLDGSSTATTLVLTGTASLADYGTAIRAVTFNNTLPNPIEGDRTIEVVVNDGTVDSAPAISTISVTPVPAFFTFETRVSSSADDAEEHVNNGEMESLTSSDLELTLESNEQIVGIRFNGIEVPKGAIVTNAYVQFQADETDGGVANLTIRGEDADSAQQFSSANGNISSRDMTTASALWQPADWNTVGEAGVNQQTADLSAVLQEIIDRDGWVSGNSLALLISGSGKRVAESFNGSQAAAPLLHIEYTLTAPNANPVIANLAGDTLAYAEGAGPVIIEQGGDALVTDIDSTDFAGGALTVSIAGGDSTEDVLSIQDSGTPGIGIEVSGSDVLFNNTVIGTFGGGASGAALVVSLNGVATATAATALVQAITYENTNLVTPASGPRTVQFVLTDGDGGTSTAVDATVTVSGSNSPPAIAGLSGDALAYSEGDGPIVIEQGGDALVTDADSTDFAGGALTVSIAGGDSTEDVLSVRDSGTPGAGIEVSGATVLFDGTSIGTFAGGAGGAALVVSLNGVAAAAAATALVQAITYENTNLVTPTNGPRTVQFVLTDGDGGTSTASDATVTVSGLNSPPAIAGLSGDALAYTEGDGPVVIEQGGDALVTDIDSADFAGGALTVSIAGGDSTEDVLSIRDSGTPGTGIEVSGATVLFDGASIGTFGGGASGAALVVSLNGLATAAAATALVQAIAYENTDVVAPTAGARTVQFVLTDGDGGTSTASDATVTVSSGSNSPPVIAGLAGDALSYTEGDGPIVIEQGGDALVTDADSTDFAGGALTVSIAGGDTAEDVLSVRDSGTPGAGIEVSGATVLFDGTSIGTVAGGTLGAALVVSLNGLATAAAATALVQAIAYENTDVVAPTAGARTVQFVLTDGDGGTSTASDATVTVSGSNSPPAIAGLSGDALSYTEGDGPIVIEQGGDALVTDADSTDFAGGALTVSIAGGDTAEDVLSVRDSGTPGAGIEVSGATVLFDGASIGTFAGGAGGAALVVSLNGLATAAAATALVQAITYENTDVVAPTAGARTVQFLLTDGDGGTSTASDATVTVSGSNSPPAIAGLSGDALAYSEGDGPIVIEQGGDALVTDADSTDFAGGALTVSIAGGDSTEDVLSIRDSGTPGFGIEVLGGAISFDGVLIGTFLGGAAGAALVVSLNGLATAAAATALVQAITYENTDVVAPTAGARTVQFVLTDGDGGTSTASDATVTVISGSNSPPVIAGLAGDALPYTEGDGMLVVDQGGDALVTDIDSTDFDAGTLTVSITAGGDVTEDVLSIRDSGTPGTGIEISGATVLFDGTSIGAFAGGAGGAALVVSLNGFATTAAATALARAITYENTDLVEPTIGPRTVQFVLTDGDGGTSTAVDATVAVSGLVTKTLDVRVSGSADDSEELISDGSIELTSSDLELTLEISTQIIGIRFNGIEVPKGATITNAYVQFQADETDVGIASLTIHGEDVDNALQFSSADGDISPRPTTAASALWQPADWNTVGEAGPDQQTVDLSAVIQEIVDRDGWVSGNSLALLISGTGKRVAESYNGNPNAAPLLHLEYQALDDGTPIVDLDADDSSGASGSNFAATFFVGDPPEAIADTDVAITDSNDTTLESATITVANAEAGDTLLPGSLPTGIVVDGSSTATTLVLTGTASLADYGAAIGAVTFNNNLPNPVEGDRSIEVLVNDGIAESAPAVSTINVATPPSVVFWTIGDTPYSSGDFGRVETILSNIPEDVEFVVHVGDIKSGSNGTLNPAYYESVADLLKTSSVPVFIIPGDNEYNDMDDPDAAFAVWEQNFDFFDQNWAHGLSVNYQAVRDENFSFVHEGKLFVGINLVGGTLHDAQEWADRSADDLAWIESNFADYGDQVTSAVIFGHASPGKSGYEDFEEGFVSASQAFTKPILYLMGDRHDWDADNPYSAAPNITRIIIDKTGDGSAQDDPLKVSLFDDPNEPYSFDHEFDLFLT